MDSIRNDDIPPVVPERTEALIELAKEIRSPIIKPSPYEIFSTVFQCILHGVLWIVASRLNDTFSAAIQFLIVLSMIFTVKSINVRPNDRRWDALLKLLRVETQSVPRQKSSITDHQS
ncbi:hypothetical protein FEM03_14015 [Phragmitibacter flavus]|uniref:Uncharacterized protein n=1 Tax=Phragmitibacter flavus TaxID=2576071 RepID=A0A5R8KDB0_9BACT|nr:hypothetical protein [Phragmitibacter flavus]TLD70296.1 hypothetical protein FEM03_14015 [Phragmitibacter flavus]